MHTLDTLVLGGGQAGLAVSYALTERGRDHLVLERGLIAERWRTERWDSLRLLTPNWMTRLPGYRYEGPDPDGFMTAPEVATFFHRYATSFDAPVREHTNIRLVTHDGERFVVRTDDGTFYSHNVVIATGWCDRPAIPSTARQVAPWVHQVAPSDYRRPSDLPPGGVLVVGAAATGIQLADELITSGREVTLAVGRHHRLPRRYRGMDIFWWLDMLGNFDRTIDDVADAVAARNEPSIQLVGRPDHRSLDLTTLHPKGVRLAGRVNDIDGSRASFATDLATVVDDADRRLAGVLARIDAMIDETGLTAEVLDAEPVPALARTPMSDPIGSLDLRAAGISTVIWATGHRRPYEWLDLPILDQRGEIRQHRGVTPLPGAYVLGQRFQHYRNSNFIDGVGRDATYVADHICATSTAECDAVSPHRSAQD